MQGKKLFLLLINNEREKVCEKERNSLVNQKMFI